MWRKTLVILLPVTSIFGRSPSFLLRTSLLNRRSWHCPLLIVLPHYGVTRLVTVIPLLKLLLLLQLVRIAIP